MTGGSTAAERTRPGKAVTLAHLSSRTVGWIKAVLFVLALAPLTRLVVGLFLRALGTNPTEVIQRSLGTWTLVFLCITLAVTPLRKLSGWNWLLRLRRMFGLYAFFYAVMHFTSYVGLDQGFDLTAIPRDIVKRPFIMLGFTCLMLMIPLAATSTHAMVRRLGAERWRALHRFVYFIAIGGVVHFWWLVKRDVTQPAIYALVVAALLGYRLLAVLRRGRGAPGVRSPRVLP
ncbi:MAG: protein-methionine-sulfoxide reductase heme-binding subunit MsrQ [Burkholderiales bacterium]